MTVLYLRFAAPVQTWGTKKISFANVPTASLPTRSGVEGLLAGCLGRTRAEGAPDYFRRLEIVGRSERDFALREDYQTVGSHSRDYLGRSLNKTLDGNAPSTVLDPGSEGNKAVLTREHLQGAEFILSISHPEEIITKALAAECADPVFTPYLGRKANSPVFPFYLGVGPSGLLDHAPVQVRPGDRQPDRKVQAWEDRPVEPFTVGLPGTESQPKATVPVTTHEEWLRWWDSHMEDSDSLFETAEEMA